MEQFGQILTLDDAARVLIFLAEGHARREEIGILLLAVAETLVTQILPVGDHVAPVLHTDHRVERMGIVADCVETADDATHRRAGDDVDGDSRLLQHLQHTDMRHTLSTAATQYNGHLLTLRLSNLFLLLCAHRANHQHSRQYHDYLFHIIIYYLSIII